MLGIKQVGHSEDGVPGYTAWCYSHELRRGNVFLLLVLESLEVGEDGDNVPRLELACYVHVLNKDRKQRRDKLHVEKSPAAATRLVLVS
jgi:hypothetical protein